MNWFRKKTIPSPELLIRKKIGVEVLSCELIGQKALESSDDEQYCKSILHHRNLKEIKTQNTFKGELDIFQFYFASDGEGNEALIGIIDPVDLWHDPYVVDYHFLD